MTKKQPSNFVKAISMEFGTHLTNFSRALDIPHSTVDNWFKNNKIRPVYDHLIMQAAENAGLHKSAKFRIKRLLDGRLKK